MLASAPVRAAGERVGDLGAAFGAAAADVAPVAAPFAGAGFLPVRGSGAAGAAAAVASVSITLPVMFVLVALGMGFAIAGTTLGDADPRLCVRHNRICDRRHGGASAAAA